MKSVNVYDFDGTIYDGDSSIDLFKFALSRNKKIFIRVLPIFFAGICYLLKLKEKEEFKSVFFSFVRDIRDLDELVAGFWTKNDKKIKRFYLEQHKKTDVVISASPRFLLEPMSKKMQFNLIATDVDGKTGKLISRNCYGEEKVKKFNKEGKKVDCFYSDSLSDEPLAKLAKKSFMVRGEKIIPWSEYKPTLLKRIKHFVFDRSFITFVAIGCINALNGILLALFYHSFIEFEFLSYSFGFLTSVIIAYFLNSLFNFRKRINLKDCIKYILGNIPNYLVQIITVYVCIGILGWNRILVYVIAAMVSVPITFAIVKISVYRKRSK